jgi:carboxyl-terminal processing protease
LGVKRVKTFAALVAGVGLAFAVHGADAQPADTQPVLLGSGRPFYPPDYARAGVEGAVTVDFIVGADGRVSKLTAVDSPDPRLTMLAAYQLKQWFFLPASRGGVAVSAQKRMRLDYHPRTGDATSDEERGREALRSGRREGREGRTAKAISEFTEALRLDPKLAAAHEARARAHAKLKEAGAALADMNEAVALDPASGPYRLERGVLLAGAGDLPGALADFEAAVRQAPENAAAFRDRGTCESLMKRPVEAMDDFGRAVELDPGDLQARWKRSDLAYQRGNYKLAMADLGEIEARQPGGPQVLNLMGWILAACPDPAVRDGKRAVASATRACEAGKWRDGDVLDTLAAADAEAGDFAGAVKWATRASGLAPGKSGEMLARLALYREAKPYRIPGPDMKALAWEDLRYHTFQSVWSTVDESYFDPSFGGVDWAAIREKYRMRLSAARDDARLRMLLQSMLGELHRTHFAIIPREGAVFNPSERVRIGGIGTEEAFIGGRVVFTEVRPGSPGRSAGIEPGDAVSRLDGFDLGRILASLEKGGLEPLRAGLYLTGFVESRLSAAVGTKVALGVVRADGTPRQFQVTCGPADGVWSEPIGTFPSEPIRTEAVRGRDGIAVLRFNAFVPQVMKDVRRLVGSLGPSDGLIIDLRGNTGGITAMAAGIAGLLSRSEFSLGAMHMRKGLENFDVYPQAGVFDGPVAILVDGQSASTSEIFAAGLQEGHRARVFGERTAGAALPSSFERLPNGDLLQYAIADTTTPSGVMIEGEGVAPDVSVARAPADLAAGRDPVAEAARHWLDSERGAR